MTLPRRSEGSSITTAAMERCAPTGRRRSEIGFVIAKSTEDQMAQELARKIDTLIPAELSRPIPTLWWPEWLQRSVSGLTLAWEDVKMNPPYRTAKRSRWVIPRALSLSEAQRQDVERRIDDLKMLDAI